MNYTSWLRYVKSSWEYLSQTAMPIYGTDSRDSHTPIQTVAPERERVDMDAKCRKRDDCQPVWEKWADTIEWSVAEVESHTGPNTHAGRPKRFDTM